MSSEGEFFVMVLPADEGKMIRDEGYEPEESELAEEATPLSGHIGQIFGFRIINSDT